MWMCLSLYEKQNVSVGSDVLLFTTEGFEKIPRIKKIVKIKKEYVALWQSAIWY